MVGSPAGIEGHTKKVHREMLQGSPQEVLQRRLYSAALQESPYRGAYRGCAWVGEPAYRCAYRGAYRGTYKGCAYRCAYRCG